MDEVTGVLEIGIAGETQRFEWNGNVEDRLRARRAFEEVAATRSMLAVAFVKPGEGKQVKSFDEIEEVERETGSVAALVTGPLAGG